MEPMKLKVGNKVLIKSISKEAKIISISYDIWVDQACPKIDRVKVEYLNIFRYKQQEWVSIYDLAFIGA